MIFDTNVVIYLSKEIISPEAIITDQSSISIITKIEALGYPFKNPKEYDFIIRICASLAVIPITDAICRCNY